MFTGSLLLFLFWLSPPHSVVWRLDVTWGRLCMVIRNVTHATVANNRFVKRCWTTFTIQNDGSGFHTGVHWTAKSRQDKNPLNPVCISLRNFFFLAKEIVQSWKVVKGRALLAWNVQLGKTLIRYMVYYIFMYILDLCSLSIFVIFL